MKYKFYEYDGYLLWDYPIIDFEILDKKYEILNGLSSLCGDYIREIVKKMEEVRDGKLDAYDFGPQDSVGVECLGPTFKEKKYRNKCYISKAFTDIEIEIPFEEIYKLMKDYLEEIEKWEKKTGKKKPGEGC